LDICILNNATVYPIHDFDIANRSFRGGVINKNNEFEPLSSHVKSGYKNLPPNSSEVKTNLSGRHLYGGMLQNRHFGHFLVESLGRIWALNYVKSIDSIVFIKRSAQAEVASFVEELFALIMPGMKVTYADEPTQIDELIVVRPSCGATDGTLKNTDVSASLYRALQYRVVEKIEKDYPKKVYVSRSKLSLQQGGIIGESALEHALCEDGYEVIHPQELSIEEQLKYYSQADKIIFADGSAFHLYVLVGRPDQQTFVVWRRVPHGSFLMQAKSFLNKALNTAIHISGFYHDASKPKNTATQKALLNLPSLFTELFDKHFLTKQWTESQSKVMSRQEQQVVENSEAYIFEPNK